MNHLIFPLMRAGTLSLALSLALSLISCGGDSPSNPEPTPAPSSSSVAPSSSSAGVPAKLELEFGTNEQEGTLHFTGKASVRGGLLAGLFLAVDGAALLDTAWAAADSVSVYNFTGKASLDLKALACGTEHMATLRAQAQDGTSQDTSLAVGAPPCVSSSSEAELPSSNSQAAWVFSAGESNLEIALAGSADLDGDEIADLSVSWSEEDEDYGYTFSTPGEKLQSIGLTVGGDAEVQEGKAYSLELDKAVASEVLGNKNFFLVQASGGGFFLARNMTATKKDPMTVSVWNAAR
jgi:hypothetical protein